MKITKLDQKIERIALGCYFLAVVVLVVAVNIINASKILW